MKRYLLAALAVAMLVGGTAVPAVGHSDPNYTGVEDITGNGSVVVERFGRYYMTAVSHRGGALGNQVRTTRPTSRYVGVHAYKSALSGAWTADWTLIDMGTRPHSPRAKVSGAYSFTTPGGKLVYGETQTTPAPTGPDWAWGTELCFTAWPADNGVSKTPRTVCGYADNSVGGVDRCGAAVPYCGMRSRDGGPLVRGGDSGGLVWQPMPHGQVRPLGLLVYQAANFTAANFAPFYGLLRHNWQPAERLAGYPTGPGGRVVTG